jgi:DNA-binding CsgD family transcriptional regulator
MMDADAAKYDAVWFIANPAYKFMHRNDGTEARRRRRVVRPIPTPKAELELEHRDQLFYVWFAMLVMTPREHRIANLYFGLDGGETMTYDQIGELFGISRERARQILRRGLKRIYYSRAGRFLEEMWGVYDGPFSGMKPPRRHARPMSLREWHQKVRGNAGYE